MSNLRSIVEYISLHRTVALAGAATVLGLAASTIAYHYLEREEEEFRNQVKAELNRDLVNVVVATVELPAGALVGEGNMAIRQVPQDYVYPETILPSHFDQVRGQALVKPIGKGQPLLAGYLAEGGVAGLSDKIPAGRRAVTINVDEVSSINGLVMPGDRIDLLLTYRGDGRSMIIPILQSVKVLATGSRYTPASGSGEEKDKFGLMYATLTLDVTPEQAERIILARDHGVLSAMLRNRSDDQPAQTLEPLGSEQLFGSPARHFEGIPSTAGRHTPIETVSYVVRGGTPGVASMIELPVGSPLVLEMAPEPPPLRKAPDNEKTDSNDNE